MKPYVDDKYIIFKLEDFDSFWLHAKEKTQEELEMAALKDAVVIRLHDVLAASGLGAYAMAAQTFIDANGLGASHMNLEYHQEFNNEQRRLEKVRDLFLTLSHRAEQHPNKKVPD